ncbi:MAG: MFS transporter [Stellaceae bacterium]
MTASRASFGEGGAPRAAGPATDGAWRAASLVLALGQPGDTLLYLLLPLYHQSFGVSLAGAGLLLAANRIIRIIAYRRVGRFYSRYGPRAACLGAAVGAVMATFDYAALSGLWALLVGRLVWGLSFAALNIATQALSTAEPAQAARRSGRSRAIIASGPMLGLLSGAVIAQAAGPRAAFLMLTGVAVLAVPLAARLPAQEATTVPRRAGELRLTLPSRLEGWSFVQGVSLEGLFVVGLSLLAARAAPQHAVMAAGVTLALRYAALILLGPVGGTLAERRGARRVLAFLSFASAIGLALVGIGMLWVGAVVVVLLLGLLQPLPAVVAAADHPGAARVGALARLATWRDLGAGAGPILAGLLLPVLPTLLLYGAAAVLLAGAATALGAGDKGAPA